MGRGRRISGGGPSRLSDADFRRLIDEAKAKKNLSDIVGRHTTLRRRGGRELVGLCPFHEERTPSFEVNDAKGLYYCHGCGASGDHFRFLKEKDGLPFRDAFEAMTNETFPDVSAEERARQKAEDEKLRAEAIADARGFWDAAVPATGTLAEAYLLSRGIVLPIPASIRFGMVPAARDEAGNWKRSFPAMIGAVTDGTDVVAIQRVFLDDRGAGKRWGKKSKLTLGRARGGALRLDRTDVRPTDPGEVILTEGPEDGLTLAQELPDRQIWVALGTAMMPEVRFPDHVHSIVVAGQNDRAGRAAVEAAGDMLMERGYAVRAMYPDLAFKDWNDQLRGIRA